MPSTRRTSPTPTRPPPRTPPSIRVSDPSRLRAPGPPVPGRGPDRRAAGPSRWIRVTRPDRRAAGRSRNPGRRAGSPCACRKPRAASGSDDVDADDGVVMMIMMITMIMMMMASGALAGHFSPRIWWFCPFTPLEGSGPAPPRRLRIQCVVCARRRRQVSKYAEGLPQLDNGKRIPADPSQAGPRACSRCRRRPGCRPFCMRRTPRPSPR